MKIEYKKESDGEDVSWYIEQRHRSIRKKLVENESKNRWIGYYRGKKRQRFSKHISSLIFVVVQEL